MRMKQLRFLIVLVTCLVIFAGTYAIASTTKENLPGNVSFQQLQKQLMLTEGISTSTTTSSETQATPGPNSCFAYYNFGSVHTTIQSQTPVVTSGVPLTLVATITNTNSYPIVDGALYIKIFKKRPDGQSSNGPAVVDEFFATDTIDLDAHASTTFSFTYQIPNYAETGSYQVATFFTTSKKFNLSGLSFTDDVVGSTYDFSIVGAQTGTVEFDKDSVSLAGQPYHFASYPPTIDKNEPAAIDATVTNSTDNAQIVKVNWITYTWDSQLSSNIVASSTIQEIFIPANESKNVQYVVLQNTDPVYLVIGQVSYQDTKSFIDVRFVRQDVNKPRLNFPAVTSFPLEAGVPVTLFSCLYNSGTANIIAPYKINLSLIAPSGRIIQNYNLTTPVTGDMMLAKDLFTPKSTYDKFTLKATLSNLSGVIVDQVTIDYSCEAINPKLCSKGKNPNNIWLWIILILVIFAAACATVWYRKK